MSRNWRSKPCGLFAQRACFDGQCERVDDVELLVERYSCCRPPSLRRFPCFFLCRILHGRCRSSSFPAPFCDSGPPESRQYRNEGRRGGMRHSFVVGFPLRRRSGSFPSQRSTSLLLLLAAPPRRTEGQQRSCPSYKSPRAACTSSPPSPLASSTGSVATRRQPCGHGWTKAGRSKDFIGSCRSWSSTAGGSRCFASFPPLRHLPPPFAPRRQLCCLD
jgi:hypothetical protein